MNAVVDSPPNSSRNLAVLVLGLVVLAWFNRFIQDDAFISFQYARNLVDGHGLTFNPGQRVEGYTNFLWTVMIAAGMAIGFEPVAWSYGLGLGFFAGSLLVTYRLAAGLSGVPAAGLLAVLLLGTNFTFSSYATGGLETQAQAFFVVAAVWASWKAVSAGRLAASSEHLSLSWLGVASAAYGLALLTRLDSVVCLLVPGLLALVLAWRRASSTTARVGALLALAIPGTLLVAPWLVWKVGYYGDILPNTFYVKVSSSASIVRGAHYVYRFLASYWLLPVIGLGLLVRPRAIDDTLRRKGGPWGSALVVAVGVWLLYVASVGGDFMEFRFIVPVLPLAMTLLAWCLVAVVSHRRLRAALVTLLIVGSLLHGATFWGVRDIESIRSLEIHMEPDGGDWDDVGRTLADHFDRAGGVLVAVGPAGAIPYYAQLDTLDMRGLVDPWVARNGIIVSTVPGHQRMAPLEYMVQQGVNLIVGHPQVVPRGESLPPAYALTTLSQFSLADVSADTVPADARVLAIPMSNDRWLLTLYLVKHPLIDAAIAANGWPVVPLNSTVRPF